MARLINKLFSFFILPILPTSKKLAGMYYMYMINNPEYELKYLEKIIKGRGTAIDIGANVGLWTYKLSSLFKQVHSFEINHCYYGYIKDMNRKNVSFHDYGLSDKEGKTELYIPVHKSGLSLGGWASIEFNRVNELFGQFSTQICNIKTLDSLNLGNVDFIKIDVEGHEVAVIAGAIETIRKNRPVIVVETSNEKLPIIKKYLLPLKYRQLPLTSFVNAEGTDGNYIFYP